MCSDWLKIDGGRMSIQVQLYSETATKREKRCFEINAVVNFRTEHNSVKVIYNASECANSPVTRIGRDTFTSFL